MGKETFSLEVQVSLYGNQGSRFGLNDRVEMQDMNFGQMSNLLKAFHILAEAIKEGRNININGQNV